MDLVALKPWLVLAHVIGSFGFVATHGVSMFVLFKVRGEHEPARIRALLDLSLISTGPMYAFTMLLGLSGIVAGFLGPNWWTLPGGRVWMWASVVVVILIMGAMYGVLVPYFVRLRLSVGLEDPRAAREQSGSGQRDGRGQPGRGPRGGPAQSMGSAERTRTVDAAMPVVDEEALAQLQRRTGPIIAGIAGMLGLGILIWLMMFKPF